VGHDGAAPPFLARNRPPVRPIGVKEVVTRRARGGLALYQNGVLVGAIGVKRVCLRILDLYPQTAHCEVIRPSLLDGAAWENPSSEVGTNPV
jgi:hypothetical protein